MGIKHSCHSAGFKRTTRSLGQRVNHVLLSLSVCLAASGNSGAEPLPPYAGMITITYDAHNHPANVRMVSKMLEPDYDPTDPSKSCAHSYHWCDEVFDKARENGLDALVQTHHTGDLKVDSWSGLTAWKSAGIGWQHPFGRQEIYPTHPDGIPLLVSGGHTDNELDALWECAEAKNAPGAFLAFYGGEYTVGTTASPACADSAGQARCGGHKLLIYRTKPSIICTAYQESGQDHQCADEGEAYALIDMTGGVVNAAHPTGLQGSDWTAYDPILFRGGISDDHVSGFELGWNGEDVPCQGVGGRKTCGFRQVLALGYKVYPSFGSDNHQHFGGSAQGCYVDRGFPGQSNQRRGICWASDFTREGLLDAMDSMRCYLARRNRPLIQWTLEGEPMGTTAVSVVGDVDASLRLEDSMGDFGAWEIICGDTTGDDGNATAVASGSCSSGVCAADVSFQQDTNTWCYLRVLQPTSDLMAVTAPIWLLPEVDPSPDCDDGTDNDGDGRIDLDDPDCTDANDPLEAPDEDEDLVEDGLDNCVQVSNPGQVDTDGDDYGNACDCDFNQSLTCNIQDFNLFLPDFVSGTDSGVGTDMDASSNVGIDDFNLFLPGFVAGVPGPSGLLP
jgi:hypothetical protein